MIVGRRVFVLPQRKKENRIYFDTETRERVLKKSKCKCAKCGKELNITTMTIDHIIPLSKGGTNKEYNLIAMCKKCNKEKGSSVFKPSDYYKGIPKYLLPKLDKMFDEYMYGEDFFSWSNLFKQDIITIETDITHKPSRRCMKTYTVKSKFQKAYYKDLNDIYEYLLYYYSVYKDKLYNKWYIKRLVSAVFTYGCWYFIRSGDSIKFLVGFTICRTCKKSVYDTVFKGYVIDTRVYINPKVKIAPILGAIRMRSKMTIDDFRSDASNTFQYSDLFIKMVFSIVDSIESIIGDVALTFVLRSSGLDSRLQDILEFAYRSSGATDVVSKKELYRDDYIFVNKVTSLDYYEEGNEESKREYIERLVKASLNMFDFLERNSPVKLEGYNTFCNYIPQKYFNVDTFKELVNRKGFDNFVKDTLKNDRRL